MRPQPRPPKLNIASINVVQTLPEIRHPRFIILAGPSLEAINLLDQLKQQWPETAVVSWLEIADNLEKIADGDILLADFAAVQALPVEQFEWLNAIASRVSLFLIGETMTEDLEQVAEQLDATSCFGADHSRRLLSAISRELDTGLTVAHRVSAGTESLAQIADTLPVFTRRCGPDGHEWFTCAAWHEFLGATSEIIDAVPGLPWAERIYPADLARVTTEYRAAYETQNAFRLEYRLRRSDNDYRWILDAGKPQRDEHGHFTGFTIASLDITQAIQSAELLRTERDSVRHSLEISGVLIATLDADFKMTMLNKVGCDVLGHTEDELLDKNWIDLFVPEFDRPTVRRNFQSLLNGERRASTYFECPIISAEGEERLIAWRTAAVRGENDEFRFFSCSGKDITDDKFLAQRKDAFVATLTHDLNTPIRAEVQVVELLLSGHFGELNPDQHEVLSEMLRSNRFMQRMVDSLLTIYRYEDHRVSLNIEATDINALLERIIDTDILPKAHAKGQKYHLDLNDHCPSVWVDPKEIRRVIITLLENAVFFSPEGASILVTTDVLDNGFVQISVADTGRGIEPEIIRHIFSRYNSITKKFRKVGTGLNLYLAKQILEAHGGNIRVESEFGHGSKFIFAMPALPSLPHQAPPALEGDVAADLGL